MEMDCSSLTESGGSSNSSPPNSSAESLNGLKFGQKIYFEDVGIGELPKSGGGSFSSSAVIASTPTKKPRGGVIQATQPPRCQVEGCRVDLSDAKAYYSRHKVCTMHSKSPKVIVAGLEQRFCQQCSRSAGFSHSCYCNIILFISSDWWSVSFSFLWLLGILLVYAGAISLVFL